MTHPVSNRRILFLLLSPLLLAVFILATVIGFAYAGGNDPATAVSAAVDTSNPETVELIRYVTRCLLIPFQLIFMGIVIGGSLWLYRRRWRIAQSVLGPLAESAQTHNSDERFDPTHDDWDQLVTLAPQRRLTLTHFTASIIGIVAISIAVALVVGQFVSLTDLAIIVTALTSALAWGARLPVSDLLGGISNLVENNFNVGDRLSYRHFKLDVEGIVEQVNLRFTWLRSPSGELITIPFGEIRTMRNFSRSTFAGVYVSFPVPSDDLRVVIRDLEELAPQSPTLIPDLLEPWRIVSKDGILGPTVELSLYGRAPVGREEELQLAMHSLVWDRLGSTLAPPNGGSSDQ